MARAMSKLFSLAVDKARKISRAIKQKSRQFRLHVQPYDISLSMLEYLVLIKVATHIQRNSQFTLSHISKCAFLSHNWYIYWNIYVPYVHNWECIY